MQVLLHIIQDTIMVVMTDPDDMYMNQPENGPCFHTNEFVRGYNGGYDERSNRGSSTGNSNRQTII